MAIEWINEKDLQEIRDEEKLNPPGGGVVDEETLKRIADLEELVEKQATTITNQAIAINKQNELLDTVDNDLNALVGGSDE